MASGAFWCPHIHSGAMVSTLAALHADGRALPAVKVMDRGPVRDVLQASPGTLVCYRRGDVADQEHPYWDLQMSADQYAGGRRFVAEAGDLPAGIYFEIFNEQMPGGAGAEQQEIARRLNRATLGAIAECRARGYFPVMGNFSTGTPDDAMVPYFAESVQATVDARGRVGIHPYTGRDPLAGLGDLLLRWPQTILPALWAGGLSRSTRPIAWATEGGLDDIGYMPDASGPWKTCVQRGWYGLSGPESVYLAYQRMGDMLRVNGFEYGFAYDFYAPGGAEVGGDGERYDFAQGRWAERSLQWWLAHWRSHVAPALVMLGADPVPPVPTPTPPPAGAGTYTVTAESGLRVRETPDTGGRVLGALPFGARVLVLSVSSGWARLGLSAGGSPLVAGASDPDPHGYVDAGWLRRV